MSISFHSSRFSKRLVSDLGQGCRIAIPWDHFFAPSPAKFCLGFYTHAMPVYSAWAFHNMQEVNHRFLPFRVVEIYLNGERVMSLKQEPKAVGFPVHLSGFIPRIRIPSITEVGWVVAMFNFLL